MKKEELVYIIKKVNQKEPDKKELWLSLVKDRLDNYLMNYTQQLNIVCNELGVIGIKKVYQNLDKENKNGRKGK